MRTEKSISADFPFASKYIEVHGSNMHYVEEGTARNCSSPTSPSCSSTPLREVSSTHRPSKGARNTSRTSTPLTSDRDFTICRRTILIS